MFENGLPGGKTGALLVHCKVFQDQALLCLVGVKLKESAVGFVSREDEFTSNRRHIFELCLSVRVIINKPCCTSWVK